MNVLIIEDETQAAQRLEKLVVELVHDAKVLATIDSVKKSVAWLKHHPSPDLILMDIQLADGISFKIFEECDVSSPVIFTTAFDEYALKAFKVNSIDYILKPVDKDELKQALTKFTNLTNAGAAVKPIMYNIAEVMQMLNRRYKSRFVIKVGEHLKTIEIQSILYFYSQEKATFCYTADNRNHILDNTLEQLEEMIDPDKFFRINRKYLVSTSAIHDIISYSNSRLKLILKGSGDHDVIVARERVHEFKSWLDH